MNIKTYIIHYDKLTNRKQHILSELATIGIVDYEFVTKFNKEELTDEIINQYYDSSPETELNKAQITLSKHGQTKYDYPKLSLSSISLCMKHIVSLNNFLNSEYEYCLIIEDDCHFCCKPNDIEHAIKKAPNNWDILFIGGAFNHSIFKHIMRLGNYILADHPSTNTTSSLIYNKKSAKKTLKILNQFSLPIDWELNYNFFANNFNVYHTVPYLATQISGSVFQSTVHR